MAFRTEKEIDVDRVGVYLREAAANARAGKKLAPDRDKPLVVPPELEQALAKRKQLRRAFDALSKGKQREYAEHIAAAKQDKTKVARLAKILPMIEAGVGLNDKYRNC